MAGVGGGTRQPRADRRVSLELEAALVRDVRIGIERDVSDRVALADQERVIAKVCVERREGTVAPVHLLGPLLFARRDPRYRPETSDRDERLVGVLLEELPLEDLGPLV